METQKSKKKTKGASSQASDPDDAMVTGAYCEEDKENHHAKSRKKSAGGQSKAGLKAASSQGISYSVLTHSKV